MKVKIVTLEDLEADKGEPEQVFLLTGMSYRGLNVFLQGSSDRDRNKRAIIGFRHRTQGQSLDQVHGLGRTKPHMP